MIVKIKNKKMRLSRMDLYHTANGARRRFGIWVALVFWAHPQNASIFYKITGALPQRPTPR